MPTTVTGVQIIVHSHQMERWTVITVAGELDVVGGPELRQHVIASVQDGHVNIVLDLTGVDYIDSFGLGVLVGVLKRARLAAGDIALVIPEPRVRRVLEVCDLDRVFRITKSVDEAVGDSSADGQ